MKSRELLTRTLTRLLPIRKNRVVFSSYYGRGYSDSPKAICEALLASGEELELLWLVKNETEAKSLPREVTPVPNAGFAKLKALATARVWVDNCRKYERIKKPGQFYLQTWHGFALKRIEADAAEHLEADYVRACRSDSDQCDLMVSGSRFMTGLYRNSFWYGGKVLETGTPRNDVFFTPQPDTGAKVRRSLGLPADCSLALYAPTFRADRSTAAYCLDAGRVQKACAERFGGIWTVLVRLHPNVADQSARLFAYDGKTVADATLYPDMQELLVAADLLITDYSSSMFDYALSGKPVVRFTPDAAAYAGDRNFYFPLEELPFPGADDNDGMVRVIRALPDRNPAWAEFAAQNGFVEDGRAARRCAELIINLIKGETI